ncbi:hypothetical protein AB4Z21_36460, partial [Paenibacillus sp. MCAF20]
MKDSNLFAYIGILKPGETKATITRNGANTTIDPADLVRYERAAVAPIEDSTTHSSTVTVNIDDIYTTQTVLVNIEMTSPVYSAWHNVYLSLDPENMTLVDNGAGEGTDPGTDPGTNPGTDPGSNPGTNPGTNPNTLADGKYSLNFVILKAGTSQTSVMNDYVAHPGRLLV